MVQENNQGIKVRQSLINLTKPQLVEILRRKDSQRMMRDELAGVLLPEMDSPHRLLVSEVMPMRAIGKMDQIMMKAAIDLDRQQPLIEVWDGAEDLVMMALKRQRVWEYLAGKNAKDLTEEQDKTK